MKKNDFISTIYCREKDAKGKELGEIKGFFSKNNIDALGSSFENGVVLQGMEYRPDKIAAYYLGDERLSWMITLANNFDKGIEDYYLGRELLIPTEKATLLLGKE